jgi:hypothetical protein
MFARLGPHSKQQYTRCTQVLISLPVEVYDEKFALRYKNLTYIYIYIYILHVLFRMTDVVLTAPLGGMAIAV